MMFVLPVRLYVQVAFGCIRKTLKKVKEHLGGNIPDLLPLKFHVPL